MKVLKAFPPNYARLRKAFPISGKPGILYAYSPILYNPSGYGVMPWIAAHEALHMARQEEQGVEEWWDKYITSTTVRLYEEILAHQAEWTEFTTQVNNRNRQTQYLDIMADRLSGPLYGRLISRSEAVRAIMGGE